MSKGVKEEGTELHTFFFFFGMSAVYKIEKAVGFFE